jgi:ApaG protein
VKWRTKENDFCSEVISTIFVEIQKISLFTFPPMNTHSTAITNGIKVEVFPTFIPKEQTPEPEKFFFSYDITITNVGHAWAKLLSRHWIIIDADGHREEVQGEGVVGYQPELEPGLAFSYTSYCPIATQWGTMEGTYTFTRRDGTLFEAEIARFYLVEPSLLPRSNAEQEAA